MPLVTITLEGEKLWEYLCDVEGCGEIATEVIGHAPGLGCLVVCKRHLIPTEHLEGCLCERCVK